MTISISFLLHLAAFGLLSATLVAGFILDRKIRKETEQNVLVALSGVARTMGLLSPIAAVLLLVTGIGNIANRYAGSTLHWYSEGWLVAKLVLYVLMVLNGMVYGPRLTRSRMKLLGALRNEPETPDSVEGLRSVNNQITLFYIVQTILLLLILLLSLFGTGKHPGSI